MVWKPWRARCAVLVMTLGLICGRGTIAWAAEPNFDAVDAFVADMIETHDMPGGALVILDATGVVHQKLFDDWPLDKPVRIASASKFLSAAAILHLVDRGVMGLDDPVSKYMPDVDADAGRITLQQALSLTTGQEPYAREILFDPRYTMQEAVEAILGRDPYYEPGEAFMYGSAHIQIAGRMAEIAAGKIWHEIFADELAGPLGLKSTVFGRLVVTQAEQHAPPSMALIELGTAKNPNLGTAAQSSAADYARFLSMLLNEGRFEGEQFLQKDTVDAMLSDQTGGAFVAISFWPDKSFRYGYGNWLMTQRDTGTTFHASDGAFGTIPWLDRRHGIAGLFVTNDNLFEWIPQALALRYRVAATMAETIDEPAAVEAGE